MMTLTVIVACTAGQTDSSARVQQPPLQFPVRCGDAAEDRLRRTVRIHSRRFQRLWRIHRRTQVGAPRLSPPAAWSGGEPQETNLSLISSENADNSIVIGIHVVQKITMKKFLFWNLTLCHNAPRDKQINCNCSAVHNYNYNHFPAQRCQNIFKNHTTCYRFDARKHRPTNVIHFWLIRTNMIIFVYPV